MARFQRASRYHLLSLSQKQALSRETAREPGVTCPTCGWTIGAADLIAHVNGRCEGPQKPPETGAWVKWKDAKSMGVRSASLHFWVSRGYVRVRGEIQDREYLLRDLALRVAMVKRRRNLDYSKRPGFWKR